MSPVTAIFITATGTDIGKTYVACALIRALRKQGRPVDAFKPVLEQAETLLPRAIGPGEVLQLRLMLIKIVNDALSFLQGCNNVKDTTVGTPFLT